MNQEELLLRLNNSPIKFHVELMKLHLREFKSFIQSSEEFIRQEMLTKGMNMQIDYMKEVNIIKYINEQLIKKYYGLQPLNDNEKINLIHLEEMMPSEPFIEAYLSFRKNSSVKKRYESILAYEKNGFIQPTFALNSKGYIYTSKPALTLPQNHLERYFDCDSFKFESLEKAMKAIENAKVDTEIITILMATVYYKNEKYKYEKEKRRQAILSLINKECDFMPLEDYYDEFTLSDLGCIRDYNF
ncbi:hypothetical protein [Fictibacillus phosphorivorans]|uniref:hypothetical protein n=1 Tax=Fictibacillus phosphorivorans TaxID=1221500 RepID=UPI0012939976|nr:hypothetical protein [Fictibacillus phosphorivorans]MQR93700.1 hypothetical protein [Fictibacillus phosphorivorans]